MSRPTTARAIYARCMAARMPRAVALALVLGACGFASTTAVDASLLSVFTGAKQQQPFHQVEEHVENAQTLALLRPARNIDPNPSHGGAELVVVDGEALLAEVVPGSAEDSTVAVPKEADQISLYEVKEGDTLSQVASMFDVSVNTIVWANGLSSGTGIQPGQVLLILPISGVQYTVKKGDTLAAIAERYGGDKDEILAYNDLSSELLSVGSVITIPGGEVPAEKPKEAAPKKGSAGVKGGASSGGGSGYFIHPVPGAVRTQGLHGYNGIDFGAGAGTPIRAAAAGTVIVSREGGWNGGYGNYVVIDHPNGTQTLYAHNTSNTVWQGQKVVQGQVIGYMGNTGRSTGNHLHFEVRGAKNPF